MLPACACRALCCCSLRAACCAFFAATTATAALAYSLSYAHTTAADVHDRCHDINTDMMVSLRRKSVHTPRSSLAVQQARNANTRQSQRTDDVPIELYQEARNEALVRYKNERKQEQQRRPQHEQERRRKIEKDDDDELDAGDLDSADSPPQPKKAPTLLERIRMEKNRVVQRCLVACRLAEPSRDVFFKQKKQEYVDAIELLKDTKRDVQELAAQVQST